MLNLIESPGDLYPEKEFIFSGKIYKIDKIMRGQYSVYRAIHQPDLADAITLKYVPPHDELLTKTDIARIDAIRKSLRTIPADRLSEYFNADKSSSDSFEGFLLVSNYIPGITLEAVNLGEDFSTIRIENLRDIFRSLLELLGYLEEGDVVYRDMKPENIICLTEDPEEKKLRIPGVASLIDKDLMVRAPYIDQPNNVHGTPEFMSPEQAMGATLTPASDRYSAACAVFSKLESEIQAELGNPFHPRSVKKVMAAHARGTFLPEDALSIFRRFSEKYKGRARTIAWSVFHLIFHLMNRLPFRRPSVKNSLSYLEV